MADPEALEADGQIFAKLASENETNKNYSAAEAAQALLSSIESGSKNTSLYDLSQNYINKIKELKLSIASSEQKKSPTANCLNNKTSMARAHCLLDEAVTEDENGNTADAIELYTSAVELLLHLKSNVTDETQLKTIKKFATEALDRAEFLKMHKQTSDLAISKSANKAETDKQYNENPRFSAKSGTGGYSAYEIKVLSATSIINGRKYLPFISSIDLRERFSFSQPFVDNDGILALSAKQKSCFSRWVRPSDYIEKPQMIMAISCFSICQCIVTDCSFVASMAISAQYERRFKKKLITNIIYPQNKNGEPVYNPCGKYMIRFHLNGVARKVIIDDLLPMGQNGKLLCSFSNNVSELWVSVLEKAYMKVMGGYDFPGSNSSIDLHALTGWIPERLSIQQDSLEFKPDREFRRLFDRFHRGHCLVTLATGAFTDAEGERTGLVPTHAYAMLDIRQVDNYRLLLLKNPWSHVRWKGNFSERDQAHWTKELQAKLNFDLTSAQSIDNGVFWIDFESICRFFDVFYINWDPALFQYTTCVNDCWLVGSGPKKDTYLYSKNPQYELIVNAKNEASVWILLTRHITEKDDFANNKEFIAVVMYRNVQTRKIYYPYDPEPYKNPVRINSPHCLLKIVQEPGNTRYTLVISQYEKSNTIHYTLRVYSTASFTLKKIVDPYKFAKQNAGEWKGTTAGGCMNDERQYNQNPCYKIQFNNNNDDNQFSIELRGPREFALGMELITVTKNNPNAPNQSTRISTGSYRRGYVVLEQAGLSGGIYDLIVSTFKPGEEGPFLLSINSLYDFQISRLR